MPLTNAISAKRFHFGLTVADLDAAVRFYEILFGVPAVKHFADYAKFEVDEPPLVLALHPGQATSGGALNHVGFRLADSAALVAVQQRLEARGIQTVREEGVECCYSLQTKFWVTDADHNMWEIYTLHEDLEHSGFGGDDQRKQADSAAINAPVIWEHTLTVPAPAKIPFADERVDEVRLEGTYNAELPAGSRAALLAEAYRVLRPGGRITVHGLVSDRPYPGTPNLPGPAAMVRTIPLETVPMEELAQTGFIGLAHDKLGDIHCFQSGGVELRELRLSALKPLQGNPARTYRVMYLGPLAQVADERGQIFRRGEGAAVDEPTWNLLKLPPFAEDFTCFVIDGKQSLDQPFSS